MLTRLRFGLNMAPKIRSVVIKVVLTSNSVVRDATDSYVDDIIVDLSKVCIQEVLKALNNFRLQAKPAKPLCWGRVLGLRVVEENGVMKRKRDNAL